MHRTSDLRNIHFEGVETAPRRRSPAPRGEVAAAPSQPITDTPRHDALAEWVLRQAGLDPEAYRVRATQRRLGACVRKLRASDGSDALRRLAERPALAGPALSAMLIGVSEFFRDPQVFEDIDRVVVRPLLAGRGGVRVTSVGVSTGEELYSMAMLVAEAGGLATSTFTGIDCRADALAEARRGCFRELRALDDERAARWFRRDAEGWIAHHSLRHRMGFVAGDLLRVALAPADVVLCRNVAIYLEDRATAPLWARLMGALTPGGYLVTGKAERPPRSLGLRRVGPCIHQKP